MTASTTTGALGSEEWVTKWVEVINSDSQIDRLGKYFDGRMCVEFGEDRYILQVCRGHVVDVLVRPIWDKPFDFKIAADLETWQRSAESVPRPFYQDIFGMMWNHGMTLEGDVVKAMQHIRTVKLMLAAMKRVSD